MTIKDYSLLPDNKSLLERGLELAFSELLYDIKNPFPSLLNPEKTDQHILPHLAQERGVPEWDAQAPESEKRQTVKNIWPIRRTAGTKKGVRLAVESLEYDAEVEPGYKTGGEPYTFTVTAWKRPDTVPLQETANRMLDHVSDAKSERDEFQLRLGISADTSLGVNVVNLKAAGVARSAMSASPVTHFNGGFVVASMAKAATLVRLTMESV